MGVIDWGDAPTWLGVVFAAGAAGAAIWTLASQRTQIKEQREFIALQAANLALERAELEAVAAERKSGQARLVIVEVSTQHEDRGIDSEGNSLYSDDFTVFTRVRNESREPLRDAIACIGEVEASGAWEYVEANSRSLGFHRRRVGEERSAPVPVVGAGVRYSFAFGRTFVGDLPERPVVFFTDSNGIRWRLDEHNDLQEVPPSS